jgi:hypothetical protein
MSPPSASAPVKEKTSASATTTTPRGAPQLLKSTHLRLCWPPATTLRQLAARAPPGKQERTPRRAARLLPPPTKRVHPPPRTDPWISCKSTHNWSLVNLDNCNKYYSGRCSTYKFDRTIVTAGAPRMLAMSTSPPSAGASSCAPAATASSATAAGAVLSCAPEATTSSTPAATGSVLPCGAGAGAPTAPRAPR